MENSSIEKAKNQIKNSVTLKLLTITVLMLLLLIPVSMIKLIIRERESLNKAAMNDVNNKWSDKQLINGPILSIPAEYESYDKDKKKTEVYTKYWNILPKEMTVNGELDPVKLRRGIYEIVVYKSQTDVFGSFEIKNIPNADNLKEIKFEKAFLTIGISDLRGVKNQINVQWNNASLVTEPGSKIPDLVYSGVTAYLPNLKKTLNKEINFSFKLNLQGSQSMSFVPLGNTTKINLSSKWKTPKFNGNFLPESREINDNGFKASWTVLQLNRNFPQSWIGKMNKKRLTDAAFGVEMILPLDDYQKSFRTAKYAVMTIGLTFLIFFLVEVINKTKIHPFQYILVGLGLCLFYTLLVSITEHSNFNLSYEISAAAIVLMITLYSLSIFKKKKLSLLLLVTLIGVYGFLYTTLQLVDYALLMGSIGLTIILGLTMYFTRNINWYKSDN